MRVGDIQVRTVGVAAMGFCTVFDLAMLAVSAHAGAAYEGATGKTCGGHEYDKVCDVFPILGGTPGKFGRSLMHDVYYQNDVRELSREQIADWLESLGF